MWICKIFFFILVSFSVPTFAQVTLEQKFSSAKEGDYIVTAQEGHYCLLLIRSVTPTRLLLEEITIPEKQVNLKHQEWQKWLDQKAPRHTSWTLYEIDRTTHQLIDCFSYSKNGWLVLGETEQFFSKLLNLPLKPLSQEQRKKIGSSSSSEESDHRPFWNPPIVIEGKKISKPSVEVFSTEWPEDTSPLSLCTLELYFNNQDPTFAFPYWIEVKSPHYTFKVRTVDSGRELHSPMPGRMPSRPKL